MQTSNKQRLLAQFCALSCQFYACTSDCSECTCVCFVNNKNFSTSCFFVVTYVWEEFLISFKSCFWSQNVSVRLGNGKNAKDKRLGLLALFWEVTWSVWKDSNWSLATWYTFKVVDPTNSLWHLLSRTTLTLYLYCAHCTLPDFHGCTKLESQ